MISHYTTVNNLNLHYTIHGQGPPAVLIHGYAHTWAMWQRSIDSYLKAHYCCHAMDLPGHGDSDKPPLEWYTLKSFTQTIIQFCRKLKLKNILLLGYSMGGLISLNVALTQPDLVSNLILINSPVRGKCLAFWDPLLRLEGLVRRPIAEKLLKIYKTYHLLAIPVELNRHAHPKMLFSPSFKQCRAQLAQCPAQSLFGSYKVVRQADLSRKLSQLCTPTLVITGDKDRVVPPDQAELVVRKAPSAKLVVIPRCGHLSLDEQPDLFNAAMKAYLFDKQKEAVQI